MVSLVVALYNEESRFPRVYEKLRHFLQALGTPWELILVDDCSSDGTLPYIESLAARDPRVRVFSLARNLGQGAALKVGVLASRGESVLYTDADLSVPLDHAFDLLQRLQEGADVSMGARWVPGARIRVRQPLSRRLLGRFYYSLVRRALVAGVRDCNCGLKAFRGEQARLLFGMVRCWRWAFNVELVLLARHLGYTVEEVPVEWSHQPRSKVRLARDVFFTLWELALIKLRQVIGIYPGLRATALRRAVPTSELCAAP